MWQFAKWSIMALLALNVILNIWQRSELEGDPKADQTAIERSDTKIKCRQVETADVGRHAGGHTVRVKSVCE